MDVNKKEAWVNIPKSDEAVDRPLQDINELEVINELVIEIIYLNHNEF